MLSNGKVVPSAEGVVTDPKTIIVTGATSGIGLEAALALAQQGHRLGLVGRSAPKLTAGDAIVRRSILCGRRMRRRWPLILPTFRC